MTSNFSEDNDNLNLLANSFINYSKYNIFSLYKSSAKVVTKKLALFNNTEKALSKINYYSSYYLSSYKYFLCKKLDFK